MNEYQLSCLHPDCYGVVIAQFPEVEGKTTRRRACMECSREYDVQQTNWVDTADQDVRVRIEFATTDHPELIKKA